MQQRRIFVHTHSLNADDVFIVQYVPNVKLRTLCLQIVNSTPFFEDEKKVEQFMTAFRSNFYLEEVLIHEMNGSFFHEDLMIQFQHYCCRNSFFRKLLQPQDSENETQDELLYDPFGIRQSTDDRKVMSTKSLSGILVGSPIPSLFCSNEWNVFP
jgi:hypothetical protein